MIFGPIEFVMLFLATSTLDTATQWASRQIRTGEFQTGATNTKANFKNLVCSQMSWLSSKCTADLWLDVRTHSTFAGISGALVQNSLTFNDGRAARRSCSLRCV